MLEVWRWLVLNNSAHRKARWIKTLFPFSATILIVGGVILSGADVKASPLAAAILTVLLGLATWVIWTSYPGTTVARIARRWSRQAPANGWGEIAIELGEEGVVSATSHAQTKYQ